MDAPLSSTHYFCPGCGAAIQTSLAPKGETLRVAALRLADDHDPKEAAALYFEARRNASTIDLVTERWPDLDMEAAEAIALATVRLYETPIVGLKVGFTSAAMRRQMNISSPNFGWLTEDMDVSEVPPRFRYIHPRVEPEIALITGKEIGCREYTIEELQNCIESIHAALEIVDTRYHEYKFTLVDNTADNSSAAGFVLGPPYKPSTVFERPVSVEVEIKERITEIGSSSDVMGGPFEALKWLVGELAKRSRPIPEGAIILTGGLTRALSLHRNEKLTANFLGLGSITFSL
jgi:2-keto-4-pentenoate hydratase